MTVHFTPSSSSDDCGVTLPAVILFECVAPFIGDRGTWNALVSVNKEICELSKQTTSGSDKVAVAPPWPQIRWRLLAGRAWSVAFGHGSFLACGTERGKIQVWNNRDGRTWILREDHHKSRVHSIFVIRNLLLSCSEDGTVLVWRNHDWTQSQSFAVVTTKGRTSVSCCCAWSDDEQGAVRFAAGCGDRKICTFRILDDKKAGMIEFIKYQEIQTSHKGPILAICKIGQFLVSGGSDEQLLAWDILLDSNLPGHEGEVQPYHMSLPNAGDIRSIHVLNDDVLAVACGKNIILYNSSLQTMKVIKGYHGNIRCVTFSLDGLFLVSAYNDGTICLWNVNDGVCIETWPGHGGFLVCGLDFQRSSLASVGSDGTVAIWDISRFC